MSDLNFIGRVSAVALAAATARTLLQLVTATHHRIRVKEVGVSFDGVVNTAVPVKVHLLMQTTAGTSSALSLVKEDNSKGETLQTTALQTFTSTEPTAGDILRTWDVHPQAGGVFMFPIGDEIVIGGGKRLAVQCTAAAAVNASAYIRAEE